MEVLIPLVFLLTVFLALPFPVYASVVINEFSASSDPEWIELYNTSTTEVNLNGYKITDSNKKTTDDINLTGTISGTGFIVFEHDKGWLNNDTVDTISLYISATSSTPIDSISYSGSDPDTSYSRIPDGTGSFIANTDPTPNAPNQAPPTPTLTNTPTLTPTPNSHIKTHKYSFPHLYSISHLRFISLSAQNQYPNPIPKLHIKKPDSFRRNNRNHSTNDSLKHPPS